MCRFSGRWQWRRGCGRGRGRALAAHHELLRAARSQVGGAAAGARARAPTRARTRAVRRRGVPARRARAPRPPHRCVHGQLSAARPRMNKSESPTRSGPYNIESQSNKLPSLI